VSNTFVLVVDLPKSDNFHTRDDLHLAKIARDKVKEALSGVFHSGEAWVLIDEKDQQPQD